MGHRLNTHCNSKELNYHEFYIHYKGFDLNWLKKLFSNDSPKPKHEAPGVGPKKLAERLVKAKELLEKHR